MRNNVVSQHSTTELLEPCIEVTYGTDMNFSAASVMTFGSHTELSYLQADTPRGGLYSNACRNLRGQTLA